MSETTTTETTGTTTTTAAPAASVPTATTQTEAPKTWLDGLTPELKGYAEIKGFKTEAQVLESYRNFEKFKGVPQERLLTLPDSEDAALWEPVYQKLGKPATKEDYGIKTGDEKFDGFAKELFHKTNLSKKQAETVLKEYEVFAQAQEQEYLNQNKVKVESEKTELKKEWGMAYDSKIEVAKVAAKSFGLDGDTVDKLESVMGHKKTMDFLAQIGSKIGEHDFVSGKTAGFQPLTPQGAQAKISQLMSDKSFYNRYTTGDKAAKQEFEQLHKMAFPNS